MHENGTICPFGDFLCFYSISCRVPNPGGALGGRLIGNKFCWGEQSTSFPQE